MKTAKAFVFVVSLVVPLVSCVTAGSKVPPMNDMLKQATGQNGRACVHPHDIRGYGVLDHDIVSIDAGRRHYLATVFPGCTDLDTSMRAIFRGDSFQLCGGRMDKMITPENSCRIKQIFEFESRKEALALYNEVVEQRNKLKNETVK